MSQFSQINDQFGAPIDSLGQNDSDSVLINLGGVQINNYVSYSFENDFFTPSNVFELVLEDNDIKQLVTVPFTEDSLIALSGLTIQFIVNNKVQFNGFVYHTQISNSRSGGSKLNIVCKDALGIANDSTLPPRTMFTPDSILQDAFFEIFKDFGFQDPKQFSFNDDDKALSIASGANQAALTKIKPGPSKKGKGKASPIEKLGRSLKVYPNEGVMEFAQRLLRRKGWNVKQFYNFDKQDVLVFTPPIYDRASDSYDNAVLVRLPEGKIVNQVGRSAVPVIDGSMVIDWSHQASMLIGECSGFGGNFYNKEHMHLFVNDITGYQADGTYLPAVESVVRQWIGVNADKSLKSPFEELNEDLYEILLVNGFLSKNPQLPINPFARPVFIYDQESVTPDELQYCLRRKMFELQQSFFQLHYTVEGHSVNGVVYQPNTIISVIDQSMNVKPLVGEFWIKRVSMTRTRGEGTKTTLDLRLPYIWTF